MRRHLAALVLAVGCARGADVVVVGSKNFTEQRLLGELMAQTVEGAGLRADRRFELAGSFVCDRALRAGEIDLYVEYTGTALLAILKEAPGTDRAGVLDRVRAAYAPAGLVWTAPLGFENTFALVTRGDEADVRTISDLARHPEWRAGFGYEFEDRADGWRGIARTYGLAFREIRTMDLGLLYRALVDRQVDVVAGNSTDGLIEHLRLRVLDDDRGFFPPYDAVPVARRETLARHAALAQALERLGGRLDAATMRRLNHAVDGEQREPAAVMREWRAAAGL